MSTVSLVILLIALAATWVVWMATKEGKPAAAAKDALENLEAGTLITLTRYDGKDIHLNVSLHERHVYEEDGDYWYELECQGPNGPVSLNVDPSDREWVSVTRRKISLEHLGLTPARLAEIEARDAGAVSYDGVSYEFEDWGEATYYPLGAKDEAEDFKYWDFEDDAEGLITIERWEDGTHEVFISEWIRRNRILVPSLDEEQPA